MLPTKESLTVEFKSGRQRPQTDDEIVDHVMDYLDGIADGTVCAAGRADTSRYCPANSGRRWLAAAIPSEPGSGFIAPAGLETVYSIQALATARKARTAGEFSRSR